MHIYVYVFYYLDNIPAPLSCTQVLMLSMAATKFATTAVCKAGLAPKM